MTEQLKLKHLAPYLPYGLNIANRGEYLSENVLKTFEMIGLGSLVEYHEIGRTVSDENCYEDVFPILRPLDNLKNPITHNGETFIPLHELLKNSYFDLDKMSTKEINNYEETFLDSVSWSYNDAITLCSWHFDVFGLIKKGLAIDINTLE